MIRNINTKTCNLIDNMGSLKRVISVNIMHNPTYHMTKYLDHSTAIQVRVGFSMKDSGTLRENQQLPLLPD
jgi:hypothetical protein